MNHYLVVSSGKSEEVQNPNVLSDSPTSSKEFTDTYLSEFLHKDPWIMLRKIFETKQKQKSIRMSAIGTCTASDNLLDQLLDLL